MYVLNDQCCAYDFRPLAPLTVTIELPTLHVSTVIFEVQCINLRFKATLTGNARAKYFRKPQVSDHYTLLRNCPPTLPLGQPFALSEK